MKSNSTIELSQITPIGRVKFTFSDEEIAMLQLITSKQEDTLEYWKKLWQHTNDYEEFLFSCKELMPSAVKKLQENFEQVQWQNITVGNANFLAGLPRYAWTKNQYVINQYKIIAAVLEKEKIDFIAIKGVCEILAGSSLSMMRTSRDIDILIKPEDKEKSREIFTRLGWQIALEPHKINFYNNPLHPHAESYRQKEGIIELDVHYSAVGGPKSFSQEFTQKLWERKVHSSTHPNLFIPSLEDRLIISSANAYHLSNWKMGQTCKYIYDVFFIADNMNLEQIQKACIEGETYLKQGRNMEQLIKVLKEIKDGEIDVEKRQGYLLQFKAGNSFLNVPIYLRYFKQLIILLFSGTYTLQTAYFICSRTVNLFCIRIPKMILKLFEKNGSKRKKITSFQKQFTWRL